MIGHDLIPAHTHWDRWKRFYMAYGRVGWISDTHYASPNAYVFESGEMLVMGGIFNSKNRGCFSELGIEAHGSNDDRCPTLYWRDEPVPKAWLDDGGQQDLLIDRRHKIAVGALGYREATKAGVPEKLARNPRIAAYYSGPEAPPVAAPVRLNIPYSKAFSKDECRYIRDIAKRAATAAKLLNLAPLANRVPPSRLLEVRSVDELKEIELAGLLGCGVGRHKITVPWLAVKGDD